MKTYFDTPALNAELNERRLAQNLSWSEVARIIGVALATLRRTQFGGRMEADGILAMVGWLERVPEDFVRGAAVSDHPRVPVRGRVNARKLYAALDARREQHGLSWRELSHRIGGVSPAMLVHLQEGGRVEINTVVAAAGFLQAPIGDFTGA